MSRDRIGIIESTMKVTAIFVLELDTVRGVVQCVNFHGFYFCPYRTFEKITIHTQGVTLG